MTTLDPGRLEALAAVVDEGSFEAAARRLHVTPSAVSQRIKALEQRAGQVLVLRSRPCRPTPAGAALVRLAGQIRTLQAEAVRALTGAGAPERVPVAVNADSLSTWFPEALVGLPEHVLVELHREDQDHSARMLRDGVVMAAVTADARAVQGCRVRPLGAMRYVAVAAPDFHARWFADGLAGLREAPTLTFNRKDALQERFARRVLGRTPAPPVHYVPSSSAFVELVRAGLGWGMVPEPAAAEPLAEGALVALDDAGLDVPLYWQHWAIDAPVLVDLTARVTRAARAHLRPPAF
ncbi:MAG: LysR family transcriptional regulator ArgP [Actinomycetales bacterium]|nr:LysR family transcriptional regulator ArgP [Actinomycetales bacterium]